LPRPTPSGPAGTHRNRRGRSPQPSTSTPRPPPFAPPCQRCEAHLAFGSLRHAAWVSPPHAPEAESSSPTTSGSRPYTDVLQVGLKCPDRYFVHARRALVLLDLLPCLLDSPLRNLERFARRLQLVHATPPEPQRVCG